MQLRDDYYRLYAKFSNANRYYAVDWKKGRCVGNLIYATLFTRKEGMQALEEARRLNTETLFELRKV